VSEGGRGFGAGPVSRLGLLFRGVGTSPALKGMGTHCARQRAHGRLSPVLYRLRSMTDEYRRAASDRPRLRAIVAIDFAHRVRCQQPGCGHSVHAAVHVVEEAGQLLVLGSTCFAKRYGSAGALGPPQYGGGSGRKLTDEERSLLAENTRALLAGFKAEEAALEALAQAQAAADEKERQDLLAKRVHAQEVARQPGSALTRSPGPAALGFGPNSPWPWQLPGTSVALLEAPDGAK
jgi:hypothetical protein